MSVEVPRLQPVQRRRRALLTEPAFLNLLAVGTLTSTARWLEMLVIGVFVFEETNSPFMVASMLTLRILPLGLFGVFGGTIAERFDRKRILLATMGVMVVLAATLGMLAHTGVIAVWHLGVGAFISGMAWVADFPVRRTLLGDIAGAARLGTAMSLDTMSSSGTRMLGPLLGGVLFVVVGLDGAFFLAAGSYGLGFVILAALRTPDTQRGGEALESVFASVRDGFRHLADNEPLVGILAVTIVFNVFGFPFVAMIPVIGKDVLGLDPVAVGLLASCDGLGSFIGAVFLAAFARVRHFRYLYFYGVLVYLILAFAFSRSTLAELSGGIMIGAGFAMSAFAAMQSALVLLNAPEASRRRMMGVLSVCIGTGPIGFMHLGLLADLVGTATACSIVAIEGLLVLVIVVRKWPVLLSPQPSDI